MSCFQWIGWQEVGVFLYSQLCQSQRSRNDECLRDFVLLLLLLL